VIDIRALTDSDLPALRRIDDVAFGTTQSDARWAAASPALERDRQLGAFDAAELVGHAAAFTHELTVPAGPDTGRVVPAAGVTWVMVSPTHRRRGVLRALMDEQLTSLHESGEAVATLWASEPLIYPRFGYGLASRRLGLVVPRAHAALRGVPEQDVRLTIGAVADLREACVSVYESVRRDRPGMVSRSAEAWTESSYDDTAPGSGSSVLRCLVARDAAGAPVGYAWYQTKPSWDGGVPGGDVVVHEALASTPAGRRAVLGFLLDVDLMARARFWNHPVDDALVWMLADLRRAQPTLLDGLWVRLVRLDEALAGRGYAEPVDVVLEVSDRTCPWNEGRWRLSAGADGAEVARSSDPPDLALDVCELGSAYLGDGTLLPAAEAGRVHEHTPGAARALHRAMRGERAPWCSYVF
jgi:predicted acetyltransferase